MTATPQTKALKQNRKRLQEQMDLVLARVTASGRQNLTTAERAEFDSVAAQASQLDLRITTGKAEEKRRNKAMGGSAKLFGNAAHITSEPQTYGRYSTHSYVLDLAQLAVSAQGGMPDDAARERMVQHVKEVEVESKSDPNVARHLMDAKFSMREQRTNPNTTAGTGGEFVPPLWLVNQYVPFYRPGRACANRLQRNPLPPGVDVINVPRITTGSTTAIQQGNAAAVSSTDIVTNVAVAPVNTIAGQEDISMQLLEQSPVAMDGVVFEDLSADYDQTLDQQVLYGTGTNGQHTGVLVQSGTNSVVCTSATFHDQSTSATQYRSIVSAVNTVETKRFASPTAIWVNPRRSNSWAYAADTTDRPLFVSSRYGMFNSLGNYEEKPVAQAVAGELFGLPVVKSNNVPITMSGTATTGGTADPVIVLNEQDNILWEGVIKMRALPEILSGTLQIRFQVYCYSALTFGRAPAGITIVSGNTGMAAPSY